MDGCPFLLRLHRKLAIAALGMVGPNRRCRRHVLTATADMADPAPQLPIFSLVLGKKGLQTKNQSDISINIARADPFGPWAPPSAANL